MQNSPFHFSPTTPFLVITHSLRVCLCVTHVIVFINHPVLQIKLTKGSGMFSQDIITALL